jgi:DNA adenine methylase
MSLLEKNNLKDVQYAEPYAGGASIALALLFNEYASTIHINDLSLPVYAFWHTALNHTSDLCRRIDDINVTMDEWYRQRSVYDNQATAGLSDLGFAALFLNRTNHSGVIAGGVIGGKGQAGAWHLDARFNKSDLIQRIARIGRYRTRIKLSQLDGLEFIEQIAPQIGRNGFVFLDPPYIEKGEDLYLNNYELQDHQRIAERVVQLNCHWVVTYDYDAAIQCRLYHSHRRLAYRLQYSATARYGGKEVMYVSERLNLPDNWSSSVTIPMSAPNSEHPLYGILEGVKPIHCPHPEVDEGPEAGDRFLNALRTVTTVPKSAVPFPFKKTPKKMKTSQSKD